MRHALVLAMRRGLLAAAFLLAAVFHPSIADAGVALVNPKWSFTSTTGAPLANGTVQVYIAGSTTPTNTWQDESLSTLNTNPIVLDSRGSATIWVDPAVVYKFVLSNAGGAVQYTVDNIRPAEPANLRQLLAASSGSSLIGFTQAGAGASQRTLQAKLREELSVLDFGAVGNGSTDDLAAFNAALLAAKTTGVKVVQAPTPASSYRLSGVPTEQEGVSLSYNPSEISGPGRPAKGNQLAAIEGVSQDAYRHGVATFLEVPLVQGTPRRFWPLYGAVDVPPGATIPAGNVSYDIVGARGQARSRSVNTRIWGVTGAAQGDQAATTQDEVGGITGGEFDVNNNTGFHSTIDGEVFAEILATGGTHRATAAQLISANVGSQFLVGRLIKAGSVNYAIDYNYNVGPSEAFYYFSDSIIGTAPALSTKNAQFVWKGRDAASTGIVGALKTTTTSTNWIGGPGSGAGTFGTVWANNADAVVLGGLTNAGTWSLRFPGTISTTIATAGVISNQAITSGLLSFTAATTLNNLAAGEIVGQEVTISNRSGVAMTVKQFDTTGGGSPLVLTGSVDAVLSDRSTITVFWDGVWTEKARSIK